MNFKRWLITEEADKEKLTHYDADAGHMGRPTTGDAFITLDANDRPKGQFYLQWKWDAEKKNGRSFDNIDVDEFLKRKVWSMESNHLPDDDWWEHDPRDREPVKPIPQADFHAWGISKSHKKRDFIPWKPLVRPSLPLSDMFGDDATYSTQPAANDEVWHDYEYSTVGGSH